jgi:hypothetical protein
MEWDVDGVWQGDCYYGDALLNSIACRQSLHVVMSITRSYRSECDAKCQETGGGYGYE